MKKLESQYMSEAELLKKSKIHTYRRSSSKARMKSSDKVLNAAGGLLAPPKRLASRQRFQLLIHCRGRNSGSSVQQGTSLVRKKSSADRNVLRQRSGSSRGGAALSASKPAGAGKAKPPVPLPRRKG